MLAEAGFGAPEPARERRALTPRAGSRSPLWSGWLVVLPVVAMAGRVDWPRFGRSSPPRPPSRRRAEPAHGARQRAAVHPARRAHGAVVRALPVPPRRALRAAVLLPLVLPPVVGGIALISLFGRRGLSAASLESAGITVAFTTTAGARADLRRAALPRGERRGGVARADAPRRRRGDARRSARDGARARDAAASRSALAAGAVLSRPGAREFGATLTFAGSLEGVTHPPAADLPAAETDPDAAVALALVLVVVAVVVMAATGLVSPVGRPRARVRRPAVPGPEALSSIHETGADTPSPAAPPRRVAAPVMNARQGLGAGDAGSGAAGAPAALAARIRVPERGVDAEIAVEAGEVLALVGSNGAGKTTVVEAIAGLVPAERSSVGAGSAAARLRADHARRPRPRRPPAVGARGRPRRPAPRDPDPKWLVDRSPSPSGPARDRAAGPTAALRALEVGGARRPRAAARTRCPAGRCSGSRSRGRSRRTRRCS